MQEKLAVVCKFGLGDDFMMNECFFRRATLTYPPRIELLFRRDFPSIH